MCKQDAPSGLNSYFIGVGSLFSKSHYWLNIILSIDIPLDPPPEVLGWI